MKIKYYIIFFSLTLLFTTLLNAQSIFDLERKFEQLSFQYDNENNIVDSLKTLFSKKADQIDREKKKNNPDQDVILDLMAGSTTVSGQLETHSKKLNQVGSDLENIKKRLHKIYLAKIDSLESLRTTGTPDEDKLNEEIIVLTAKNLLVAPRVLSFSFNPSKVLNIDLGKVKDPKEKSLYREYLENAHKEVSTLLEGVTTQSTEIDEMVSLQNKTEKFLEETEFESKVFLQKQRNFSSTDTRNPMYTGGMEISNAEIEFSKQVQSYQLILRQLDIKQISKKDIKWDLKSDDLNKNLSLKDYQSLLKEVKKRLQEYKLVLANKIGSSR